MKNLKKIIMNKRIIQLEKMLEDNRWNLKFLVECQVKSGQRFKQTREIDLVCDEMEFIIEKIREIKTKEIEKL